MQHLKLTGCGFVQDADSKGAHVAFSSADRNPPSQALLGVGSLQTLDISRSCASRTGIEGVRSLHTQQTRTRFHAAFAGPINDGLAQTYVIELADAAAEADPLFDVLLSGAE